MVATRNHPSDFQESPAPTPTPEPSPRKRNTRASAATMTSNNTSPSKPSATASTPETPTRARASRPKPTSTTNQTGWSHTPSNLTLIWLAISLPLVCWDAGYVLLRPASMPGGWAHSPLWKPYALYGEIDHVYGWKAYNAGSGWTAAQTWVNVLETVAYGVYLYLVYAYGVREEGTQGRGAPERESVQEVEEKLGVVGMLRGLSESRTMYGRVAGVAVLVAYTTAQITFWKTVLYWLIELFSGFDNIGHNDWATLFFMWIVPNGAWLALPAYMIYVFGQEIMQGLELATTAAGSKKGQ